MICLNKITIWGDEQMTSPDAVTGLAELGNDLT